MTFKLTDDITLSGEWTPIGGRVGDILRAFAGTFDGDGKTISNLTITGTNDHVGLFGYVNGGTVTNVNLAGVSITGNATEVGGVVGGSDNGTITNCTVSGTISGINYVGGVVGYSYNNGTVKNCTVSGEVTGNEEVGGVVGQSDNGTVTGCTVSGTIGGNATDVGGVVGKSFSSTVTNCTNTGTISGKNCIGGVVGISILGTVSNSSNNGEVTGCNGYVGGVIGYNYSSTVSDNTDTGTVSLLYKLTLPADATDVTGGQYTETETDADDNILAVNVYAAAGAQITFSYSGYLKFGDTVVPVQDGSYTYTMTEQDINVETATYLDYAFEQQDDAYLIKTPQDLQGLAAFVNAGKNCEGLTFKLADDITLDETFTSIGTTENPFKGTFDGNDKTISNLTTDLFVNADEAAIQNFRIVGTAGDDVINLGYGSNVTIDALAGNDQIENSSAKVTIDGGTGSNTIILSGNTGTSDEQNVEDIVIKAGKGANNILVGANQKLTVNDFGRDDVISLNVLLEAENFNIVEGNLVAGNVTVGGLGDFVEGGTFSAADDGSIVYAGDATEAITVARATKNSNGDNTTSIVTERKEPKLAEYIFKLTGLERKANGNVLSGFTYEDVVYTVHYTAKDGDTPASYYITKSNDTNTKYMFVQSISNEEFDLFTCDENGNITESGYNSRDYDTISAANLFSGVDTSGNITTVTINGQYAEFLFDYATTSQITISDGDTVADGQTAKTYNLAIGEGYTQFSWMNPRAGGTTNNGAFINLTKQSGTGDWYVSKYENNTAIKKVTATTGKLEITGNINNIFVTNMNSLGDYIVLSGNEATLKKALLVYKAKTTDTEDTIATDVTITGGLDILFDTGEGTAVPTPDVTTKAKWEAATDSNSQAISGSFTYTSAASTAGFTKEAGETAGTTVITYTPEETAAEIFTISGLGSNVVTETAENKTVLPTTVVTANADGSYAISLTSDVLLAAASGIGDNAFSTTIAVAPKVKTAATATDAAVNYTVTLGMASATDDAGISSLATSKTVTKAADWDDTNQTYTTETFGAYFDTSTENEITAYAAQTAKAFTFDQATTAKITSVNDIGFTAVNKTEAIEAVAASGTEGQEGYVPAVEAVPEIPKHYEFTFAADKLPEADVVITGPSDDTTAIYGKITGTYTDGTTAIARSVTATTDGFTFQNSGYQAGYISQEDIAKLGNTTTGTFAENLGDHKEGEQVAAILYAGQRGGESFTISGLKSGVVSDMADAAITTATTGNTIALGTGVSLDTSTAAKPKLTLSKTAIEDGKDIVLTNTAITNYEKKADVTQAKFDLALTSTGATADKIPQLEISVNENAVTQGDGQTYVEAYAAAYKTAAQTALSGAGTDIKNAASFKGTTGLAADAKTDTYTYTSTYNNACYAKEAEYSSSNANAADLVTAGYMAADGQIVYKYIGEGDILKKTDFTISGLKKGLDSSNFEEIFSGTSTKDVAVNYATNTVSIGSNALPDKADRTTIKLEGLDSSDGVSSFDLDFGDNESQDIGFCYKVAKDSENDNAITYTVQLGGTTKGYKKNSAGEYEWIAESTGCEQLTITGLADGQTLTKDMFTRTTDETTGKTTITFTPTQALLGSTALTAGTSAITLTYKGNATKNTYTTEDDSSTPPTPGTVESSTIDANTTFAFDSSKLTGNAEYTAAHWEDKATTVSDTTVGFVYMSDAYSAGWQPGTYDSSEHKIALNYSAAVTANKLFTVTGLKSGITKAALADVKPVACASDGIVHTADDIYVAVETTPTGSTTPVTNYYKESDTTTDAESGALVAKSGAKAVELSVIKDMPNALIKETTTTGEGQSATTTTSYYTASEVITSTTTNGTTTYSVKTKDDAKVTLNDKDVLLNLPATVYDPTAMTGDAATPVTIAFETAATTDNTYHLSFGDSLAYTAENKPVTQKEGLEETTTRHYKYSGEAVAAYFQDTASSNTHTYTFIPEVKAYSFELDGVTTGLSKSDLSGQSAKITFAEVTETVDGKSVGTGKYTVTLTADAINGLSNTATNDSADKTLVTLSNVQYGGENVTAGTVTLALPASLTLGEGASAATYKTKKEQKTAAAFTTTESDTTATNATYTYKGTAYDKYFDVGNDGTTIDFHKSSGGEDLFTVTNLKYDNATQASNKTLPVVSKYTATDFTSFDASKYTVGTASTEDANSAAILVDEDNKKIILFKSALNSSGFTFTPSDNMTAYDVQIFDQTAYDEGLAAAKAAADEAAAKTEGYSSLTTIEQKKLLDKYEDKAAADFEAVYGTSKVGTDAASAYEAPTMTAATTEGVTTATFTVGYQAGYYTDNNNGAVTGAQTFTYTAQTGFPDKIAISNIKSSIRDTDINDSTEFDIQSTTDSTTGEITYTVSLPAEAATTGANAKAAKTLFDIVYTPAVEDDPFTAASEAQNAKYTVKPYDGVFSTTSEQTVPTITVTNGDTSSTATIDKAFDVSNMTANENLTGENVTNGDLSTGKPGAFSATVNNGETVAGSYTFTAPYTTAGLKLNNGAFTWQEEATEPETVVLTGLKSGLVADTILVKKAVADDPATEADETAAAVYSPVLKDSSGNVVVCLADYDEWAFAGADTTTGITAAQSSATDKDNNTVDLTKKIRISKDALDLTAIAATDESTKKTFTVTTKEDGAKYSFGGLVKSEQTATSTTAADGTTTYTYADNYFLASGETAPSGTTSTFTEKTKNSDGTSDYYFESSHSPQYFKAGEASQGTTTYTYTAGTTGKSFTLKNLKSGLTKSNIDEVTTEADANKSTADVVITVPAEGDTSTTAKAKVELYSNSLPDADASIYLLNNNSGFTLALGNEKAIKKEAGELGAVAKFTQTKTVSDNDTLTYTSPKTAAYYEDDGSGTITAHKSIAGSQFDIIGVANSKFINLTANKTTGLYDADELEAAGLTITINEDGKTGTVTINENALPSSPGTLQVRDSDSTDTITYSFAFGGNLRDKAEAGPATVTQSVYEGTTYPNGEVVYTFPVDNYAYYTAGATDETTGYTTYTYTAQTGGAQLTITGLTTLATLTADELAAAVVVDSTAKTVTLSAPVLQDLLNVTADKSKVEVKDNNVYSIKLATDDATKALTSSDTYGTFAVATPATGETENKGTYTYTALGTTKGYAEGTGENLGKLVVKAADGGNSFTISGLAEDLATEGSADSTLISQLEAKGITVTTNGTVYVGADALGETEDIVLTSGKDAAGDASTFTLKLNSTTEKPIYTTADAATKTAEFDVVSGVAVYTDAKVDKYYTKDNTAATGTTKYTITTAKGGAQFSISGLSIADTQDAAVLDGITVAKTNGDTVGFTVTITDTDKLSHTGKVELTSLIKLDTDTTTYSEPVLTVAENAKGSVSVADDAPTIAGAWAVETGTATYQADGKGAYFKKTYVTDSEVISSLEFVDSVAAADKFALSGLVTTATTANEAGVEYTAGATADDAAVIKITTAAANVASADNGVSIASNAGEYIVDLNSAIKLTATANADKISVTAAGTVDAGAGDDFITVAGGGMVDGGAGNDTFDYRTGMIKFGEGNDTVNYLDGLTIYAPEGYTYSFQKAEGASESAAVTDVLLKNGENTLLITGAVSKTVNFYTELGGDKSEVTFDRDLGAMLTFDKAKGSTGVTLNGAQDVAADSSKLAYTGDSIGSNEFEFNSAALTIVTVDASHYSNAETGLTIEGNLQDNVIIGTNYGDTIDAKAGSDTVTGGKGNDVFVYSGGDLTVTDFNAAEAGTDTLKLGKYSPESETEYTEVQASINSTAINGSDVVFTLDNEQTITLKDAATKDGKQIQVVDNDGTAISNSTYSSDGYILDGTSVTLASTYQSETGYVAPASITSITAQNTTGTTIDASANTAGVTVDATAAGNTVIGGTGADKFTGSDKADTFVYSAGADTVTNFDSLDAVSLGAEVGDISKIAVTADNAETADTDESKVTFTFGEGKTLELDGAKDSVKVNGENLFVGNDALYDTVAASATSVSLTSGATAADFSANENIVTIDASKVTAAIEIKGNAKDNVITAGTGSDTVTGGKGNDIFAFSEYGTSLTIKDFSAGDTLKIDGQYTPEGGEAANLAIDKTAIGDNDITFTLNNEATVKLENVFSADVDTVQVAVTGNETSNYTYGKDGFIVDGNSVTLASTYQSETGYVATADIKKIDAQNTTGTVIDASAVTGGVEINATAAGNTVIGGTGADKFTGSDKADTFVYSAGADTVTNFDSLDAVSLGAEVGDISKIAVTKDDAETADTDESKVTFTFGEGKTLELDGAKDSVKVNGENLFVGNDALYNTVEASATSVSLTSGATAADFSAADSKIETIDASKVATNLYIAGNANNNSIVGSDNSDTINAGTGSDTVTGGKGEDVFSFAGGALTITDYTEGEDRIANASGADLKGVSFSGDTDVVLNYGEGNTVTIKDGADKQITFGDNTTAIYSKVGTIDSLPPATTAITLAADTKTAFDPNNIKTGEGDAATLTYPNLSTINSGQVTTAIQVNALDTVASYLTNEGNATGGFSLVGGAQADTLVAGKGGDYLAGGEGADSIVAGDGADTIVLAGDDTVKGFGTTDKLTTDGYTLDTASLTSIPAADETGTATADITLTLTKTTTGDTPTTETITAALQGVAYDTLNGSTVSLDSKVYSFNANTIAEGTTLTVTGSDVAPAIPANITTVDASKATNATITGGTATTSILGGDGADSLTLKVSGTIEGGEGADTLVAEKGGKVTGGEGNDIFAFNGGTLEITDYASGDKVSLRAADETASVTAITMDDLKSITVTDAKESTESSASVAGSVALGFGTDSVTFSNLDDPTAAINIADKEYKFKTGLYGVGSEATVIAENAKVEIGDFTTVTGGKVTVDGSAATANLKLTLNDTGAALGGTGADTLIANAGGTLTGGDGKDVFSITGGTAATVTDYNFSDDTLYVDKTGFGEYETIAAGEGKDAVLTFKSGEATKTVTLKDGADKNITIQYGSGKKDTVSAIVSSSGELNDAQTAITLNAGAGTFNASETAFSKLASIDAHLDTVQSATITANDINSYITNDSDTTSAAKLFLQGGAGKDTLIAGTKGDTLDGGAGDDTLTGGNGKDVFRITDTGKKSIVTYDAEAGDTIALGENVTLTGATIKDVAANTKKNIVAHTELTLAYDVATLNSKRKDTIVAGSATLTDLTTSTDGYKVNINDTEYTFLSDRITAGTAPNQAISLTSAYAGVTEGKKTTKIFEDTVGTYGTIDAAWTSKGFSLIGGGSEDGTSIRAVAITGGTGADTLKGNTANDTLTGGDGKDVFIYNGGNDSITDYVGGTDKVSFDGFTMADVTSVSVKKDSVTADDGTTTTLTSGTVVLGFEDGAVSIHSDDDMTATKKYKGITIADSDDTKGAAYIFDDGQIASGKSLTLFDGDETLYLTSNDYKSYTNVTVKYAASVSGGDTAKSITLTESGSVLGGKGKDTLIAAGTTETKITLTGGAGNDMFIFNGGQVTVTDYGTGNNTLAIADGWEITGATDGTIELSNGTATGSVTLQDFADGSKINLATTDAKGKYKATSAYFTSVGDSAALADNASGAKAKGATVFGSGDFSNIYYTAKKNTIADGDTLVEGDVAKVENNKGKLVAPTITAEYAALTTITAGSSDVTIVGNDKANTITIENASSSTESDGSSVKGGLGNDTFIIGGGNATVDYFGIGATAVYDESANGTATVKLASKITTTESTKTAKVNGESTTVTTAYAYSTTEDAHNAQGKDVLKVEGKVTGVEVKGLDLSAKNSKDGESTFSVTLTYTDADGNNTTNDTYTVDLTNIVRQQKVNKSGNRTDGFTYEGANANADFKDLSAITIWDTSTGKSKKLTWKQANDGTVTLTNGGKGSLLNTVTVTGGSGDSDVASNDVFKDDNYTTGGDSSLSDIVSNDTADTAIGDLNAGTDTTGLGTVAASSDSDSIIKRTKKTK